MGTERSTRFITVAGIAVLAVVFVSASMFRLEEMFSKKFENRTGRACWLWDTMELSDGDPRVIFFAKSFVVPRDRDMVRIKVAADPNYDLYLNGREIGGSRTGEGREIDAYDVTELANIGRNRIVAVVRSSNGVGGLLCSIDFGPMRENEIVSDRSWEVYHRWTGLIMRAPVRSASEAPRILGRPPFGRWNYPEMRKQLIETTSWNAIAPVSATPFRTTLPVIRVVSGIAVRAAQPLNAVMFDFGRTVTGRPRLELRGVERRLIRVRYLKSPDDLSIEAPTLDFALGEGERVVVDPEESTFRYIVVFGVGIDPSVIVAR